MINYVKGDATEPQGEGRKIIVHCVNDCGKWGAGFVLALSKKWPEPEERYRRLGNAEGYVLGTVQFIHVEENIAVANLVGQHGTRQQGIKRPIRYDAISDGFDEIARIAKDTNASIHMPRMGAGLAGGDWAIIALLIHESFSQHGIAVTVYDL